MRTLLYRFCRGICRLIFLPCRICVVGKLEQREGPLLLVGNHISHFDPPALGICVRPLVDFMAMKDLFAAGWSNWLFTNIFAIPVDREGSGTEALRIALQRLNQGRIVGVFPEGGLRTGDESILESVPLPPGAALLSLKAECPVVPVLILGTDQLYAKQAWWRRPELRIEFLPTIYPVRDGKRVGRSELNQEIDQAIKGAYQRWKAGEEFREEMVPVTAQARWAKT
ncbi:MAG: lysophospholipid acyltransferase family protein [Verrucomicrobiota bacterium]